MTRVLLRLALLALLLTPQAARAQDSRRNMRRQFDFNVLSWSRSFCAGAAERGGQCRDCQCAMRSATLFLRRPRAWPQCDDGFPEYCQIPAPRLNRGIVSSMLDLMPAPRLIFNEWDRHGTCSGQSARDYFETIRKARSAVKIPVEFTGLKEPLSVTPHAVEEAFIRANPGLSADAMAVGCDAKRLTEVRLCLSKGLHFRDCGQIAKRSCRHRSAVAEVERALFLTANSF